MTTKERDKWLSEITEEIRRIRTIPIKSLSEDANIKLVTARNFLKTVKQEKS